jgi:hypothetical protein
VNEDIIVGINPNKRSMLEVVAEMSRLGFELKDTLEHIYFVFGSIPRNRINEVKRVKGVYSVELDKHTGPINEE